MLTNIKKDKRCVLCKYWFDPMLSALYPKTPHINIWEIDDGCSRKMCIKKGALMQPLGLCGKYESELKDYIN